MEVELKMKEILPETEDSTHFIGIYAYDSKGQYLLAFTPLNDETDLSAESQSALIFDTLELDGKDVSNVICLFGDNRNTNKSVANKLGVPFIGCASHRFNLAVNSYLYDFEGVLDKVSFILFDWNRLHQFLKNFEPSRIALN